MARNIDKTTIKILLLLCDIKLTKLIPGSNLACYSVTVVISFGTAKQQKLLDRK